jgi:hypothetical protein
MLDLSEDEDEVQAPRRIVTALTHTPMEVGRYHYRLRHRMTKDSRAERCYVGNCGQVDEVCAFHPDQ